jgi:acetylglutamate synthase
VTTESISSTKRMFGSSASVHNFHFYQEMSKLAGFDMEAAESMNIAMQEALEKVQANVAKRAGKMDYTIGPAITKERVGLRLKPSYSPKKRKKPNLQRK